MQNKRNVFVCPKTILQKHAFGGGRHGEMGSMGRADSETARVLGGSPGVEMGGVP